MIKYELIIIDDDVITHFILKKMIERNPFFPRPFFFENAVDAIHFLKRNHSSKKRFLIFLDINMPTMSGWQFLSEINDCFSILNLSIVMISSSKDDIDISKALQNKYVIHFITKPLKHSDLLIIQYKYKDIF